LLTQSETTHDGHLPVETMAGHADVPAPLVIGFVNNAPPSGRRATQRQFQTLLEQAVQAGALQGRAVRMRCFAPDAAASQAAGHTDGAAPHADPAPHEDIDALWSARLDGLIVTGVEPRAAAMTDEPAWPLLARLIDWAGENTISTIWSCLSAHAAMFRLDGLARRPLPGKLSGVFAAQRATPHDLTAKLPPAWPVPHSRCNGVDEAELIGAGYTILSHIATPAGTRVDMFARQDKSLFVFQQGHGEYGPETLLREYRRDVRRFLANERATYPAIPEACFDADMAGAMTTLRDLAMQHRSPDLLAAFDTAATGALRDDWRDPATTIYAAWLTLIEDRRTQALQSPTGHTQDLLATAQPACPATALWTVAA
jgi:homoserine O-succinyltransferase